MPAEFAGTSNFPKPQRADAKRATFVGDLCGQMDRGGGALLLVVFYSDHLTQTWLKNAKRVIRPEGPLLLMVPEMLNTSPGENMVWLGFGVTAAPDTSKDV